MPRSSRARQDAEETVAAVVAELVATPETVPAAPAASPTLEALDAVVRAITHNADLAPHREKIEKLIQGQEQRAQVIDNLLLTHDFTRMVEFLKARGQLEATLLAALNREGGLTPTESLAFLQYLNAEIKGMDGKIKMGGTPIKDVLSMLAKFETILPDEGLQKRLANTTPQGREIIRRVAHKLAKSARGTRRTVTPDD